MDTRPGPGAIRDPNRRWFHPAWPPRPPGPAACRFPPPPGARWRRERFVCWTRPVKAELAWRLASVLRDLVHGFGAASYLPIIDAATSLFPSRRWRRAKGRPTISAVAA